MIFFSLYNGTPGSTLFQKASISFQSSVIEDLASFSTTCLNSALLLLGVEEALFDISADLLFASSSTLDVGAGAAGAGAVPNMLALACSTGVGAPDGTGCCGTAGASAPVPNILDLASATLEETGAAGASFLPLAISFSIAALIFSIGSFPSDST